MASALLFLRILRPSLSQATCKLKAASFLLSLERRLTNFSLLTIKGAPDVLLDRCTHYIGNSGAALSLDATAKERIVALKDGWSSQGRRVLLLAHKALSRSSLKSTPSSSTFEVEIMEHARSGLTLVGLVAIVDPPRPEIADVVRTLRTAGIKIFMVSFRAVSHSYPS